MESRKDFGFPASRFAATLILTRIAWWPARDSSDSFRRTALIYACVGFVAGVGVLAVGGAPALGLDRLVAHAQGIVLWFVIDLGFIHAPPARPEPGR